MLEFLRARVKELLEKRSTLTAELDKVLEAPGREKRDLNEGEATAFTEKRAAIKVIDGELEPLKQRIADAEEAETRNAAADQLRQKYGQAAPDAPGRPAASISVRSEPMTYDRDNGNSYFLDRARAELRGDREAADRLSRHGQEMDVELPAREARRQQRAEREMRSLDQGEKRSVFETRANPNRTDGQGGYFVPPAWLIDEFIDFPRFGRPFANRVRNMSLPAGTDSINVPKIASGSLTASQSADGQQVVSQDMTDTFINAPVRTIAGQQDVAMQLLDQSPASFDQIIFGDLTADLNMQIDTQCINGSGTGGTMLGVLNVSGTNTVTANATQTVVAIYPNLASGLSQIAKQRKMPADSLMLPPSLWYWLLGQLDSQNRPLVVPGAVAFNPITANSESPIVEGPAGVLLGVQSILDGNIPATLGGGSEQRPFAVRADDLYLWEGTPKTRVLTEVLSGTLQVRFQIWEYAAFMPNRRPQSISIFNGAGYNVPSGF